MLAYYVEWHTREAWREVLFADEDQTTKATRDPVASARRSAAAEKKVRTGRLDDGTPVRGFRTLLDEPATIVRNTCRATGSTSTFLLTMPNPLQLCARELIHKFTVRKPPAKSSPGPCGPREFASGWEWNLSLAP